MRTQLTRRAYRRQLLPVAAVLLGAVAGGCAEVESPPSDEYQPATVSSPDANGIETVSLTREAVQHIDLATEPVRARGRSALVVPYAAIVYDKTGQTWVYTQVGEQSFRRVKVAVRSFDGPEATLSSGPPVGTRVVTTGVTQVYGTELGMASKH